MNDVNQKQRAGCHHQEVKQKRTLISISLDWTNGGHETVRDAVLWLEKALNFKAAGSEKNYCLESFRKCLPLKVATGVCSPHSRSSHRDVLRYARHPEFLGANLLG